jgi:Zn-dependent protease
MGAMFAAMLAASGHGTALFPSEFSFGSISLFFVNNFSSVEMRTLGISAIVIAVGLAALSIIFIQMAHGDGWSGGSACSMAESLCRRPSLMAIPVLATMAWGLLLLTDR